MGRAVVEKLKGEGHTVRVMSRRPERPGSRRDVEWAEANLATGMGIRAAVAGVDAIVHAATDPFLHTRQVDVEGTRRLLDEAGPAGVSHIVYPSIVGIEHLAQLAFPYYKAKVAVEQMVSNSGLPWSILRATQFYSLVDRAIRVLSRSPVVLLDTEFRFQPIAESEVAGVLAACVTAGPGGRLPEVAGPQVLTAGELARVWLAARGRHRLLVRVPLPGRVAAAFRRGALTRPERTYGHITWESWLSERYAREMPAAAH